MWEHIKEIVGDLILIGSGLAFLFIFISIAVMGGYMAIEETTWVLYAEIGMGAIILIIGIDRFVKDI